MDTKLCEEIKNDKIQRILGIYTKLMEGKTAKKEEEVQRYKVNPRTIQRDIQDITAFLERDDLNTGIINRLLSFVVYVRKLCYSKCVSDTSQLLMCC